MKTPNGHKLTIALSESWLNAQRLFLEWDEGDDCVTFYDVNRIPVAKASYRDIRERLAQFISIIDRWRLSKMVQTSGVEDEWTE